MNIYEVSKHLKLVKVILSVNSTRLLGYIVKYSFFSEEEQPQKSRKNECIYSLDNS